MESPNSYQIERTLFLAIQKKLFQGKAIVVYGPRQVGKTTIVKKVAESTGIPYLYVNCDEPTVPPQLTHKTSAELKQFVGAHSLVIIDEAQRIEDIGITLKLLVDTYPEIQIIATGSSSFDLANKIMEPLTGRAFVFHMFPLSLKELYPKNISQIIPTPFPLIYGTYPAVALKKDSEAQLLTIADNYLYKDALAFQDVKNPSALQKLLQALAFQIGSQVSSSELGDLIGHDKGTIERYLSILEQAFIIFRLRPFSRNLRNELKKTTKIYFYDNGIRNAVIRNFHPLELRSDIGQLWENFVVSQIVIHDNNRQMFPQYYFWRTQAGNEIDLVRDINEQLQAIECKWSSTKVVKVPRPWTMGYPNSTFFAATPKTIDTILHQL